MTRFILYTDGASRGNPGEAACGVSICDMDGNELDTIKHYIGEATNNQAEYQAVVLGLKAALQKGATEVELRSDSELLVKQIKGEYRVKNPNIRPLYDQVTLQIQKLKKFTPTHVRRELNRRADQLANLALDER